MFLSIAKGWLSDYVVEALSADVVSKFYKCLQRFMKKSAKKQPASITPFKKETQSMKGGKISPNSFLTKNSTTGSFSTFSTTSLRLDGKHKRHGNPVVGMDNTGRHYSSLSLSLFICKCPNINSTNACKHEYVQIHVIISFNYHLHQHPPRGTPYHPFGTPSEVPGLHQEIWNHGTCHRFQRPSVLPIHCNSIESPRRELESTWRNK